MMRMIFPAILACALLLFPYLGIAVTIHVPADLSTIQAGIDSAIDGDLVLVSPGTYVEDIDFLGKAITVRSESGPDNTIIDWILYGTVVKFVNNETEDTFIDGFTIRNGEGTGFGGEGGGIYCNLSSPTIQNCIIRDNRAYEGGGLALIRSSFPTIKNCTILENVADQFGGAIYSDQNSSFTLENSKMIGNTAPAGGGILCMESSPPPIITNCLFSENIATTGSSAGYGGGIGLYDATPIITNCTFAYNYSITQGGGIYHWDDYPSMITNCIFWGNLSAEGPQIYGSPNVTYSDIQGGWSGIGNIDLDPNFVDEKIFHISISSPCIDAGTNSASYIADLDLDDDDRIIDGDSDGSTIVDMGVDEYCDTDGDDWASWEDCDDSDQEVNPGSDEICFNQIDDDCDGQIDSDDPDCPACIDLDGDGYGDPASSGCVFPQWDCDDTDPYVNPGAQEGPQTSSYCSDGIDNDCDGLADAADPDCAPVAPCSAQVVPFKGSVNLLMVAALGLVVLFRRLYHRVR